MQDNSFDILSKVIIPVVTIIISLLGSFFVTFKSMSKNHKRDWQIELREALSSFVAIGAYIPLESTEKDLWEYRKRLLQVQLLLTSPKNKQQGNLMLAITALQNFLMNNHNQKSENADNYSELFSEVMVKYYDLISAIDNKRWYH